MSVDNLIDVEPFIYGKKEAIQEIKKITPMKEILFIRNKEIKDVSLNDFIVLNKIGVGSFGNISLVEYKSNKELYAMKMIKKNILLQVEQVENALLEKKILQTLEHPFLLSLNFCFQTEDKLYFIMPFINGGKLMQHLKKLRRFDEEK